MKRDLSFFGEDSFFGDILQWLSVTSKSGVLTVVKGEFSIKLFFKNGELVGISSSDPFRLFGQFLISKGIIDENTLKKALEFQEKIDGSRKIGEIISELTGISSEELSSLVKDNYRELLLDIFMWKNVKYYFTESDFEEFNGIKIEINLNDIIVEGVKRIKIWKELREFIPDINTIFKLVEKKDVEGDKLTPFEREILKYLKVPSSVRELMCATRRGEFEITSALFNLFKKGFVEIVHKGLSENEYYDRKKREIKERIKEHLQKLEFEKARESLFELMHFIINGKEYDDIKSSIDNFELEHLKKHFKNGKRFKLKVSLSELKYKDISPIDAFLLSRINGGMDVDSLLKLVPLKENELLKELLDLKKRGFIEEI